MEPQMIIEEIVIIGAVGTAINIAEQINDAHVRFKNPQKVIGLCIDSYSVGSKINGITVISSLKSLNDLLVQKRTIKVLFSLYRPDVMQERAEILKNLGIDKSFFTNFIHPTVYISNSSNIGVGNVVLSNSSIQSNVSIDDFNIINSNVVIEHDSIINTNNFIAANVTIGANVNIQKNCFIGLNTSIRENITLDNVFVGMHSMVLNNFSNITIKGIPAR